MSPQEPPVERAEQDDYDLLTYGEVAARLSDVLAEERRQLAVVRAHTLPDPAAIATHEARIAELLIGRERYEHQAATAELFVKRFGLPPRKRQ